MQRLTDQVAIVTGGALGIGGATARLLAKKGVKVLIADNNLEAAKKNVNAIKKSDGVAEVFFVDVINHEDIKAMVKRAVDRWGRLDILVNNAIARTGDDSRGSALEVTDEGWDKGMAAVVKHIFLGTKYAVPEMQKVGGGSIVNIASVHGLLNVRKSLIYETGKTAVIGMTRQMAIDFGPLNIRVNSICPGLIITEKNKKNQAENPEARRFNEEQYPLRRTGRPENIGNAVVFLCSEEASFITGHALVVDGGLTIQLQSDYAKRMAHYIQ